MSPSEVVDPDGVQWSARRRWYPWRRALSLRDSWSSTPAGKTAEPGAPATDGDTAAEEGTLPRNVLLKVAFVAAAAVVWVVYGVGKLLFYTVVVVLFLVISLLELLLELAVLPIVLLLRLIGATKWPVDIRRAGEHVATRHGGDFAAAGDVRDGVLAEIRRGDLPVERPAAIADSKPESVGSFED